MKPHVHCEVIKAWADGAQIQCKGKSLYDHWVDIPNPTVWNKDLLYRVKPREFKDGAFYPVKYNMAIKDVQMVAQYVLEGNGGVFYLTGEDGFYEEHEFTWIGEELPQSLWENDGV